MACLRHSYPRGSKPGSGRKCQRCDHIDGENTNPTPSAPSATTPAADVEGARVENPSEPTADTAPELSATLPAIALPEHSPLGASSSERWMKCPGSVALSKAAGFLLDEEDDPEYRRDGVQAHALAAWCLQNDADAWEGMGQFPDLTDEMMDAVQVYIDFVRTLPSRVRYIEHRMHRPEFHPDAYGTGDYIAVSCVEEVLDFADYKHGAGVVVEVEGNTQLSYYIYLFIGEDRNEYPDDLTIRGHIVQPRAEHPAGPVRTWEVRAGDIRRWAREELRPAMERTANDRYLSVGDWCRFCPARQALLCPAMACLSDELLHKMQKHDPERRVKLLDDEPLGDWYEKATWLRKFAIPAIEQEVARRVLAGAQIPNAKAVYKKSVRVWKQGAPLEETFGDAAWHPRELKSPAQVEALPHGKEFVAEYAFQPETGLTVAHSSDTRRAVEVKTGAATFGAAVAAIESTGQNPVEVEY